MENNKMNKAGKLTPFASDLEQVIGEVKNLLIDKNNKYGDSALNPLQVFSKLDPMEAIKIRMDDKLSRLKNNQDGDTEDPMFDLLGYLLLFQVAKLRKERADEADKDREICIVGDNPDGSISMICSTVGQVQDILGRQASVEDVIDYYRHSLVGRTNIRIATEADMLTRPNEATQSSPEISRQMAAITIGCKIGSPKGDRPSVVCGEEVMTFRELGFKQTEHLTDPVPGKLPTADPNKDFKFESLEEQRLRKLVIPNNEKA